MTMTKIPSQKVCCTYGHGPLKVNLRRSRRTMTLTKIPLRNFATHMVWSSANSCSMLTNLITTANLGISFHTQFCNGNTE